MDINELRNIQSDVSRYKQNLEPYKVNVENLIDEIQQLENEANSERLNIRIAQRNGQSITANQTRLNDLNREIADKKSELTRMRSDITGIEASLNSLVTRVQNDPETSKLLKDMLEKKTARKIQDEIPQERIQTLSRAEDILNVFDDERDPVTRRVIARNPERNEVQARLSAAIQQQRDNDQIKQELESMLIAGKTNLDDPESYNNPNRARDLFSRREENNRKINLNIGYINRKLQNERDAGKPSIPVDLTLKEIESISKENIPTITVSIAPGQTKEILNVYRISKIRQGLEKRRDDLIDAAVKAGASRSYINQIIANGKSNRNLNNVNPRIKK